MLGESEIRAARLAVSRYGADPARVQHILQTVLAALARGEQLDLLDVFEDEEILSGRQVHDLRFGLAQTQIDPDTSAILARSNGASQAEPDLSESQAGLAVLDPLGNLRQLGGCRILRRLGEGGMGAVFLAFDKKNNRQVALKVLSPEQAAVPSSLDRFHREGKSGLALSHPNLVRNYQGGHDEETELYYLVLEYVDGPSAYDLLERFGRLKVGDAVHIILDVARGLEHAHHRAIVHRDIKPSNVLLTSSGVAKLSDLGLSKRTDEVSHLTLARQGVGTPYYMPYEQALNAKRADERSDLYALGATLYHLLTGEVPFPGNNPLEILEKKDTGVYLPARFINPDVPEAMERILARMLARAPEDRYPSASALIVELERAGLAADVPSFVDRDLALRDPLVRERLQSAPQPTHVDLQLASKKAPATPVDGDFWFIRFRNRAGRLCTVKLTAPQVLQRVRERRLSLKAEASRSPQGTYKPLAAFAEFKTAARPSRNGKPKVQKADAESPERTTLATALQRWWWVLASVLAAGILVLVMAAIFFR